MRVRLSMFGRGYPAATHWPESLDLPAGSGIDDALEAVRALFSDGEQLPESCLVVVSGRHVGTVARHDRVELTEESELVLIAPVAGG